MNQEEIRVRAFRHGEAEYKQEMVESFDRGDDLTKKGVSDVYESAMNAQGDYGGNSKILILASPYGRTVHTGNIISQVFLALAGKEIEPKIQEIINFKWTLFQPLLEGGTVKFGVKEFCIDKKISNPNDYGYQPFLMNDCMYNMDFSQMPDVPQSYIDEVRGIESIKETAFRFLKFLEDLMSKPLGDVNEIILSTHDGVLSFPNYIINQRTPTSVTPGNYIDIFLNCKHGILVNKTSTQERVNLFDEFEIWK